MKETKKPPVLTLFLPFEASLLGGTTIVYKNQLRDYSLKESLSQNRIKLAQKFKQM